MKQKGFTLIELLAVIVILAIIALIATPMILGVIDTAKRSSAKSSIQYYVEAVEKTLVTSQLGSTIYNVSSGDVYTVDGKTLTKKTGAENSSDTITIDYKGDIPSGTITFGNSGLVSKAELTFPGIIDKLVTYDLAASNLVTIAD